MRHAAVILLLLALALVSVSPAAAAPSYSLTVNPGVPVSRGTTVTLTLSVSNGGVNNAYTVSISVLKPNGTGVASTTRVVATDNKGVGATAVSYPDPSFTAATGTVATDVGGVYTVHANQTSPSFIANIATTTFTVTSQLTVVLSQPTTAGYVQRGQKLTITATVSDLSGPINAATVYANTPPGGKVYMSQVNDGVYSADYQLLMYDPLGPWTILANAADTRGNSGLSGTVTMTVTKSDLIVDSLVTYNSKGLQTTDFSPGDTMYPFFRLRYSSGPFLNSGQFRVAVWNPSGTLVANLTAVYDNARFGFYTPAGYPISIYEQSGSWAIGIGADSANDGFGNTGPNFTTTIRVQVVTIATWTYLSLVIGGVLAALAGAVVLKRYDRSVRGFDYLEELMGGPMPRASSLLLLGDPGSGKTIFSYEFLYDELETGKQCALLSYDAFPEDVHIRMKEFGWDITSHLRKSRIKIIDCYSGLAGEGEGAIKDPSDLTELNIRVTSIIAKAKGNPVTLVLDSLTPIFNGVEAKQAIMFLQTVAAKIKRTGGVFYMTGSTGAISADSLAKLKSIVDGVVELTLVRAHRHVTRFLSVLKMERRKISSETVPFEIDRKRGIIFRVSRIKTMLTPRSEVEPGSSVLKGQPKGVIPKADAKGLPAKPAIRASVAKTAAQPSTPKAEKVTGAEQKPPVVKPEDKPVRGGMFDRLRYLRYRLWRVEPPSAGLPSPETNAPPQAGSGTKSDQAVKPDTSTKTSRPKNHSKPDTESTRSEADQPSPAKESEQESASEKSDP